MQQSIHQYVIDQLQAEKGRWPVVAEETGISRRTIEKIARREVGDPGVSFIERLSAYFQHKERASRKRIVA